MGPEPDSAAPTEAKHRFLRDLEAALRGVVPEVEAWRTAWREADPSLAELELEFALVPGDGGYALVPRFLGDAGPGQAVLQGCMHNALAGLELEGLNEGLRASGVLGGAVMRVGLRPPPAADAG